MITLRRSEERGHVKQDWLDSHFTFSFASYYDPAHMGFRALRVINDDRIAPGRGFGAHAHRDMEILTYPLEGSLTHRDSMGHIQKFGEHEIQVMSAGTGVINSEFNVSDKESGHFLQIWIEPAEADVEPSYQEISYDPQELRSRFRQLAGPIGTKQPGVAEIHQDASVFASQLPAGETETKALAPDRHAWVHVARGNVIMNGIALKAGDGAAISDERELSFSGGSGGGELLFFDLA